VETDDSIVTKVGSPMKNESVIVRGSLCSKYPLMKLDREISPCLNEVGFLPVYKTY